MSARARLVVGGLILLSPLLLAPALVRPKLGLLAALAPILAFLATRSVAYPVALAGVPTLVIALMNSDPFPNGSVVALLVAWTVLAILLGLVAGTVKLPVDALMSLPVLASMALALVMLMRLSDSAVPDYGSLKTKLFILQNLVFLIAGLVIGQQRKHLDIYLVATLVIAGASAALLLYRLLHGDARAVFDSRFTISSEEGPIQFGRQSAEGLIIGVYALFAARTRSLRLLALGLTPILGVALVGAGSRGPVLGAFVGLLVILVLAMNDVANRRRVLLLAGSAVATTVLISRLVPGQSIDRSLSFLTGSGSGLSSNGRYALWSEAYSIFTHHPLFGIGTGGFFGVDRINQYPHNLLFEVAAESGIIGLALLLVFFLASIARVARAWVMTTGSDRLQVAVVSALFATATANALFSGDIENNSSVWLAAGLGLGLTFRLTHSASEETTPAEKRPELLSHARSPTS